MKRLLTLFLFAISSSAQAAPKWNRLYAPSASASSYLQNNWNRFSENYHPSYALDGDPKTAWVEGAEGDGLGEWIEWPISTLANARAIKVRVRSGYFKSKPLFEANAAPKEVRIEVRDTSGAVVAQASADLPRKMDWQEVVIDTAKARDLGALRIAIVSAHAGKQYHDTCVSDVEVLADSDVPYKADVEKAKLKALLAWAKERKKQAAYFAKLPKTYPFTATHFDTSSSFETESGWDDQEQVRPGFLALAQQLATNKLSANAAKVIDADFRARMNEVDAREKDSGAALGDALRRPAFARTIQLPDGIDDVQSSVPVLSFVSGFLEPDNVSLFEANQGAEIDLRKTAPAYQQEMTKKWKLSPMRIQFADAAKKVPAKIYFVETIVVEERSVYEGTNHHVITCDAKGRPQEIITKEVGNDGHLSYQWIRLNADASGRIDRIESKRASYYREFEEEPGSNTFGTSTARARVELAKAQ